MLLLGGLVSGLVGLVRLFAARTRQLRMLGAWLLVTAANAATLSFLFVNFPSV